MDEVKQGLFCGDVDVRVVKPGRVGADDRAYADQQHRKRKPNVEAPITLPDTRCCGRCANWQRPVSLDGFGTCAVTFVVTGVPAGEKWPRQSLILATIEEAEADDVRGDNLRTRMFAEACSRFVAAALKEAA